jgi:3-hydroxyacyl-[acyl-carrier-protein] dehydratase
MPAAWIAARGLEPRLLDRAAVAALLPQRPPLLLVDRVLATTAADNPRPAVAAALQITGDEAVLAGHFPGRPVWPGSYTLEGLAQACLLVGALCGGPPPPPGSWALVAAAKIKWTGIVRPPARLDYFVEQTAVVGTLVRFTVQASVAGRDVATGTLDVAIGEVPA